MLVGASARHALGEWCLCCCRFRCRPIDFGWDQVLLLAVLFASYQIFTLEHQRTQSHETAANEVIDSGGFKCVATHAYVSTSLIVQSG